MVSLESFRPHYGPGVNSTSNRNEYQEYFLGGKGGRCIRLTTLPPSCADCFEVWEPQPPGILRASPGLYRDIFTFTFTVLGQLDPEGKVTTSHETSAQNTQRHGLVSQMSCAINNTAVRISNLAVKL
jgi:hypothetical protein